MASMGTPTHAQTAEDLLITALPPETDYITYLTIVEYHLTPENLPTLNRLLEEDDGTLATEIGWDLLKLVLPILRVEPSYAERCLDIIARRGNPREVIVRVAEELGRLGRDESDNEADPSDRTDGLPTFAGEAPRVHLGNMTLQGMPVPPQIQSSVSVDERKDDEPDSAVEELTLQTLLSMLSLLHPRIKTNFPSRFLATSLPAALSAYRRMSMSSASTLTFLDTLTRLAGRERPALPPRVSTSDVLKSAPLPDPEFKNEPRSLSSTESANDAAIIQRLLQAVLLEIVDEHTTASADGQPPLTARIRILHEPTSVTSSRSADLNSLNNNTAAQQADSLRSKFVSVARALQLDILTEIVKLTDFDAAATLLNEDSEYPSSPAQIPFSASGLLLLYSAQLYLEASQPQFQPDFSPSTDDDIAALLQSVDRQYESDARLRSSAPAIDSLLSLLYIIFCIRPKSAPQSSPLARRQSINMHLESQTLLLATHNILRDIFTSMPDADLRDNAHHIASHILHGHCARETRVKIIKSLLEVSAGGEGSLSPIHKVQSANVRAVGVDWLRAELFPTSATKKMMDVLVDEKERKLAIEDLDRGLIDALFPGTDEIADAPAEGSAGQREREVEVEAVDRFAAELPYYIASLNLLCLIAKAYGVNDDEEEASNATASAVSNDTNTDARTHVGMILSRAGQMTQKLETWKTYLNARLAQGASAGAEYGQGASLEVDGVSLPDVFALDDAVTRAKDAMGPHTHERVGQ